MRNYKTIPFLIRLKMCWFILTNRGADSYSRTDVTAGTRLETSKYINKSEYKVMIDHIVYYPEYDPKHSQN